MKGTGLSNASEVFVHDGGASVSLRLFDFDLTFTTDRSIGFTVWLSRSTR